MDAGGDKEIVRLICPDVTMRSRIDAHVDVVSMRGGSVTLYCKDGRRITFRPASIDKVRGR